MSNPEPRFDKELGGALFPDVPEPKDNGELKFLFFKFLAWIEARADCCC